MQQTCVAFVLLAFLLRTTLPEKISSLVGLKIFHTGSSILNDVKDN